MVGLNGETTSRHDALVGNARSTAVTPGPRRLGPTLRRHLLVEMLLPTLLLLLLLSVLVLTEDMLGFSVLVMNRGFGPGAVASTALFKLIPAIDHMLPFALLTGCLVALGRLAGDRELLVLEASGLSAPRLFPPLMLFATGTGLVALALSLWAAPWANRRLDDVLAKLAHERPWSAIQAGAVHRFGNWKIRAQEASPDGSSLRGVQLWVPSAGQTIFARQGLLEANDEGEPELTLHGGTMLPGAHSNARMLRFDRMTTQLPSMSAEITRRKRHQLGGYSLAQLRGKSGFYSQAELHRRWAAPAATLLFGALALPLFLSGSRHSRSGGWLVGIAATLAYYGLVHLGRGLGEGGLVSPVLAVWLPNGIFALLAGALALRMKPMSAFAGHSNDRPWKLRRRHLVGGSPESRTWPLPRHVATRFLTLALFCFGVLLVAYLVLDIMERVERFTRYGATPVEVLRYYSARLPVLASRIVPMALLVATTLTVSGFAAHGELIAMRSCGIPAPRGLLPILLLSAATVPFHFLLTDQAVPRAQIFMDHVNDVEIKDRLQDRNRAEVWYGDQEHFYEADLFDPKAGVARNLTLYELGPDGFPIGRSDIALARHVGGGLWRLRDHVRVEMRGGDAQPVPAEPFARLGSDDLQAEVDTRQLSIAQLQGEIEELVASGVDATPFRVDLYVKVAAPLACLVLPALALFFALGGSPPPSVAATLVFSACVAAAYALLSGVGISLGYAGTMSPVIAAFGPVAAFALAAAALATRLSIFR